LRASLADAQRAVVGDSLLDLDAGVALARRGDDTLPTASPIMVPIAVTRYDLAGQGMPALDDRLRVECAHFYLRPRMVACVLTKEDVDTRWVVDAEAHGTIGRMGEAFAQAWGPTPIRR
jgi:hypothetical protein